MAKFRLPFTYERAQQHFDIKNIFVKMKGKDVNVFDMIQANREDTEILPTLRKYGNLEPMKVNHTALEGEFKEYMRLEDVFEAQRKANEIWDNIPAEIKEQFNNNQEEFIKKAPQWLDEKIKTLNAKDLKVEDKGIEEKGADDVSK